MRRFFFLLGFLSCGAVWAVPQWISGGSGKPEAPAPVLTRTFSLAEKPKSARLELAVAGWCEVTVNGRRVGEDVLSPVTCQPTARLSSLTLDLTSSLRVGENEVSVLLGNGWWNAFTRCTWLFHEATWVSAPKVCGRLVADGRELLATDAAWRAYDSPIVFTALRNGEWYDARREGTRPRERAATVEKYAPNCVVTPEDAVPCRVFEAFEPKLEIPSPDGSVIYDFGANVSGWCEIDVSGPKGAKVCIDYDESLTPSNSLLGHVVRHVVNMGDPRPAQHDEYTLAGRPDGERWHPRFTYHGFRYAKVTAPKEVRLGAIRARFVHSAFARAGTLQTSDATFAALQAATERSYLSNFVGIPTDCPHREKNGWTGDAQLAMETGLWNFDAKAGYQHFLRMMIDAQMPNGAVPCIVPCAVKFGYGWGSGPAWDAVLFEIPWQLYRFYGDDAPAREAYGAMKRYLSFIRGHADADGLYEYGLGDWCPPDRSRAVSVRVTDSAYVYQFHRRMAFWARRFGEPDFAATCEAQAGRIRAAFNRAFYKGDGMYAKGEQTALAAALFFEGLCADGEERKVAERLVAAVRANAHKADFGILGAKWVPRVLADYGYADDAWRLFVQPEEPGWANWLRFGDGTLREMWDSRASHNHIMFGDLSAWAYEHLGGIKVVEPGFRKIAIRPQFPKGLESFTVRHRTRFGEIRVSWKRVNGKPVVERSVPEGIECVEEEDPVPTVRPDHPRMFFNADTWPEIKAAATGEPAAEALRTLLSRCSSYPDEPVCSGTEPAPAGHSTSTPLEDVKEWGAQAAECALAWRFTGEAKYLEKTKHMLASSIAAYHEAYRNRRAVNWFSTSRILALCAYDWIYEALTENERRSIIVPLVQHVEDVQPRPGRPTIVRRDCGGVESGFYGVRGLLWYSGLAAFGDGFCDELARAHVKEGFDLCRQMIAFRTRLSGDDGGLAHGTPQYVAEQYPWAHFNFLHTVRSACGEDLASRHPALGLFPNWLWWHRIERAGHPTAPHCYGFGDGMHQGNLLPVDVLFEHATQYMHFFREADPDAARLAATLRELAPNRDLAQTWPMYPFVLATGTAAKPFAAEEIAARRIGARHFEDIGQFVLRSGNRPGDTYCLYTAGSKTEMHKHRDEGNFVIFKNDFLALDSGSRALQTDCNLRYYYAQTVAHNCVLIRRPGERMPKHWGVTCDDPAAKVNDGGQYEGRAATVLAFETNPAYTYIASDATAAYGEKCTECVRQFVHLQPDVFVVYDRVGAGDAAWRKSWLLHVQNEPSVDGRFVRTDCGTGRMFCETVLPREAETERIGGKGREFWSNGRDWSLDPAFLKIAAEDAKSDGCGPYFGNWRCEVSPKVAARDDRFLHVITVGDRALGRPTETRVERKGDLDVAMVALPDGRTAVLAFHRTGKVGGEICVGGSVARPLAESVQKQKGVCGL